MAGPEAAEPEAAGPGPDPGAARPAGVADVPILDADGAAAVVRSARRIAIVGASPHPWRAVFPVMAYLMTQGYECVPINPTASAVLGRTTFPSLEAAVKEGGPFDIVDVFRRAEHTPEIARSAVATGCGTLWLQQDVINWEAARIAHEGGLSVVMDRCTAVDHRRMVASR